jgi:hypothetical protein
MVQAYRTAGSRQEAVDSCCSVAVGREPWAGHGGEAILYFGGCIDLCHKWCKAMFVWAYQPNQPVIQQCFSLTAN